MLLRLLRICFLCASSFTVISTEPFSFKDILEFFTSTSGLDSGNTSKNPFDPAYMDSGSFKKENNPFADKANCFIEDGLAIFLEQCNSSTPYRTYDGSCNNLVFPTWGRVDDCHTRLLQGSYRGKSGLRRSVKGGPLPSPRQLVLDIFTDSKQPSQNISFLFTVFGQMIAHDMSLISTPSVDGSCCSEKNSKDTLKCAPVFYPPDDPFFSQFNLTCQSVIRSKVCPLCLNVKRQQPNDVTATIDGSVVYGVSKEQATKLRTMDGTGRMRFEGTNGQELLPSAKDEEENPQFCPEGKKPTCFVAGDVRVNQHSTLMSIQTLFMREHNKIAGALAKLNPNWDGETLYQEARKIVGAELQNIVYSEYLPSLVGPTHMAYYNLSVQTDSQPSHPSDPSARTQGGTPYKPLVRLGIWNEFTSAVFRLHTMVPTRVGLDPRRFLDYYSNPRLLRRGQMDSILQGTCQAPTESNDRYFVEDVTEHFRQQKNSSHGVDLVSTDIQRGRDHGMPPYVKMLKFLTLKKMNVKKFEDLAPIMSDSNIKLLKNSYRDVRDVDLFTGAVMENHVPNSNLGPTACSIVSLQFNNLKFGDRFYFEHEKEASSFTPAQRETLKNSSLSRVLCDNTAITTIQRNSMLLESPENPVMDCRKIPSIDLSLWKKSSK